MSQPEPTVRVRPAAARFSTRTEGVISRHAFSFGEHYDPTSVGFGPLLVCNEDVVTSGHGYDPHPHRDAEIITWVISGSLVHTDSYGNSGVVYPGLAQRMSAGTGIIHSERNDAYRIDGSRSTEPVHFIQMWVRPDESSTTPGYAQRELSVADRGSGWVPVASGRDRETGVSLGVRAATLSVTTVASGAERLLPEAARVYLHVCSGAVELADADLAEGRLSAGDAAQVTGRAALRVIAHESAELLVWAFGR